jgi:hypothetical protein
MIERGMNRAVCAGRSLRPRRRRREIPDHRMRPARLHRRRAFSIPDERIHPMPRPHERLEHR